jgi:hypothetical protein
MKTNYTDNIQWYHRYTFAIVLSIVPVLDATRCRSRPGQYRPVIIHGVRTTMQPNFPAN